jgi:hypothetical protein
MSSAQSIDTSLAGSVVCAVAAIAAPRRSAPAPPTTTGASMVSVPVVPVAQRRVVVWSSPHAASNKMTKQCRLMCAQRTHSPMKLHHNRIRGESCPVARDP